MTPKTYADVCRLECPDGCGEGLKRSVSSSATEPQFPECSPIHMDLDGCWFLCTAPTPEALIERLLAEAAALREELARLKGERAPKLRFNSTPAPKKGEPGWLADEVL